MKKVVKLTVLLLIVAVSAQTYAQKFGVRAGVNFANMTIKDDNVTYSKDSKFNVGYNVGVTGEFDFNDNLGLVAGLIVNTKGSKYSTELKVGETKTVTSYKTNLLYLDIPVSLKGMYVINDGTQIYATFGPYLGIGLTGKNTAEVTISGSPIESLNGTKKDDTDIEWGSDADKLKRLDYGLRFGLGAEFSGFLVEASYKLGLADIDNIDLANHKVKHSVIGLSVGYNLGF